MPSPAPTSRHTDFEKIRAAPAQCEIGGRSVCARWQNPVQIRRSSLGWCRTTLCVRTRSSRRNHILRRTFSCNDPRNDSIQMTDAERNGGCLCGNIRYRVTSQPRVHYCHCDMCRRATGSAFAVLGWVPSASLWWLKDRPFHRRSSPIAQRGFCRDCGSPITLVYDASPSEIALHIGTFDDPSDLTPHYNYGSGQRLGWICCGIDLPHHDREERW
ncbi:GFA family protein [Mesorhizobium sp. B2-3-3]|nr:GFA family protein [Mesorhizobium sp. B2-3-3]